MRSGWKRSKSPSVSPVRGVDDRLAGDGADRKRGTATGVTVELGHHDAVEFGGVGEGLGDADRVLAGHRVDDEQHVVRLGPLADLGQLVHQVVVDVQAARGVDDQDVAVLGLRLVERPLGDVDGVTIRALGIDVGAGAAADGDQLVDRRRAIDVAGSEGDVLAVLAQQAGQLAAGGRLTRALQAGHQDHGRPLRGEREVAPGAAHQRGQLLVDDLHDLLAGVEALQDIRAQAALLHGLRELLDDLEVDVGLEQREADLPHRAVDVGLGQLAAAADVGKRRAEALGELVKHGRRSLERW